MFQKKINRKLGILAAIALTILCFYAGFSMLSERLHLLKNGTPTNGIVTGIHSGVKGGKMALVEFETHGGLKVIGRDIHMSQWIAPNEKGDKVDLYNKPDNPEKILIIRGVWIWSNPAFLFAGSLFFLIAMIFVMRYDPAPKKLPPEK